MYQITHVSPAPNHTLKVTFSNGKTLNIDMSGRIKKGGVFAALLDPTLFLQVKIGGQGRYLEWPGEIDICSDSLWYEGTGEVFSPEKSKAS